MNISEEIKQSFKKGSSLTKLIYINLAVFLTIKVLYVLFFLFNYQAPDGFSIIQWFAVPAKLSNLIIKPWTIITYMFLHERFWHILVNMLWLFWLGRIFLEYFDQKKLVSIYLLGGLSGAALYIIAFNIFPVFKPILEISHALGASAAVLAIVIAISVYVPNYIIYLFFFRVKLKYIAIFSVLLDIISIPSGNAGGHIAHLGGAFLGYIYIQQFRKGKDIAKGFNRFIDNFFSLFKTKRKLKVSHKRPMTDVEYNKYKAKKQIEIDEILDKISKSGYDSLTKEEKEILFRMSNKK